MLKQVQSISVFIKKILDIILPFGKKDLLTVSGLILLQAIIQALGIFSIMPFLSLATSLTKSDQSLPVIVEYFLDFFPGWQAKEILLVVGIATILLLLSSAIINCFAEYQRNRYGHYTVTAIATYLLKSYEQQPYIFHLNNNSSDLIKRALSDIDLFSYRILFPLLDVIARLISIILIVFLLVIISPWVSLAVFLSLSFCLGLSFHFVRNSLSVGNQRRHIIFKNRAKAVQELLIGIKPIKIQECGDNFTANFNDLSVELAGLNCQLSFVNTLPRYLIESVLFVGVVISVISINYMGVSLEEFLPLAGLLTFSAYRLLPSLSLVYTQLTAFQSFKYLVDIIRDDLKSIPQNQNNYGKSVEQDDSQLEFNHNIFLENLTFFYPNTDKSALKNINLTIEKGQRIGIVGASGSGKSTLVDVLIGLLEPSQGVIKIDDVPLDSKLLPQWHRSIGYVPQDVFLIDDTLEKNIAFGIPPQQISKNQLSMVAKIAKIDQFVNTQLPQKYETICGEAGVRLSGGQRQRIAIARALYHNPSILVFDEATSALDSNTEKQLIAEIEQLPRDLTVVMVAHRLSTLRNCDTIYVMSNGKIIDRGSYSHLAETSSSFKMLGAAAD